MSARSSKFMIGLFVISGFLICAGIIIWIGAARILMKGSVYAVYFDESVQGLQVDSAIKYRGVEIGKVQHIDVAPDYRLIEVLMKIDLEGDLEKQTIASLKSAGITGIVFIELDRLEEGERARSPKLTFQSDYPVIPSRPSDITRILTDTGVIMQNIRGIDFKGISNQLIETSRAIEVFMQSKKLHNIVTNLESSSAGLDEAITKINASVSQGRLTQVLDETMSILTEARGLVGQARAEIESLNLKEKSQRADALIDDVEKKTRVITTGLQDTSENLRITSENLKVLSDGLKNDPSELLFSKPAPPRKPME